MNGRIGQWTGSFPFGATGSDELKQTIVQLYPGMLSVIILAAGQSNNGVTRTLNIYDDSGLLLYTHALLPDATNTPLNPVCPIFGGCGIGVKLSGDAGGSGGSDTVKLYTGL